MSCPHHSKLFTFHAQQWWPHPAPHTAEDRNHQPDQRHHASGHHLQNAQLQRCLKGEAHDRRYDGICKSEIWYTTNKKTHYGWNWVYMYWCTPKISNSHPIPRLTEQLTINQLIWGHTTFSNGRAHEATHQTGENHGESRFGYRWSLGSQRVALMCVFRFSGFDPYRP